MKRTLAILLPTLFLFLYSCNITQEYNFNKDMSGTSNMEIDISALIGFMGNMDSLENQMGSLDSLDQSFASVAEEYKKMGATNVNYGWKNNKTVLFLTYDYKDINMLNKLVSAETGDLLGSKIMGDSTEKPEFIKKGKKLIYNAPEVSNDTIFNNEEMASMKEYYNYSLKFNFATEIKRLKSEKAELSSDKKSIEYSGSLFDIFSPDYTTDFQVKLKSK